MPYVSPHLVHFVGARDPANDARNWSTLEAILRSGEILAGGQHGPGTTTLQRNLRASLSDNTRYLPSVACFADIPAADLTIHTGKYGRFGLAIPKDILIQRGVRPVLYVPRGAGSGVMAQRPTIDAEWDEAAPLVEQNVLSMFGGQTAADPGSRDQMRIEEFLEFGFLTYIKFYDPALPDEDPNNFYMEREWRSPAGLDFEFSEVAEIYVAGGWRQTAGAAFPTLAGKVVELT